MFLSVPGDYFLRIKGAAKDRSARFVTSLGFDLYMKSDDRRILENVILPYFAGKKEYEKLLFVGCEWYTRGYRKEFTNHEYWTLDSDPYKAQYGSRLHIHDDMENIHNHFQEGELDLIICNGVFGWGLDKYEQIERAFSGCFRVLRPGGKFILGWNDLPRHCPVSLAEIRALKRFEPHIFPPLSAWQVRARNPNRHIYNFYIKAP